jgi:DNA-binding NarL/FixJ family response regulator
MADIPKAPTVVFNVLVVDDDPVVRRAVRALLEPDPSIEVVGAVESAEEAVDVVRGTDVDLVVLDDILAGELSGQEAAPLLKRIDPELKIVLFSIKADLATQADVIDAFVSKSNVDMLLATVRLVLGLSWANVEPPHDDVVNLVTRTSVAGRLEG